MLKKEFKRKDVERLRNLIKGNTNDSAETQIGYTKKIELYQEGDVWEENGKKWTIKDGIKQSHTKLDQIKKEVFTPLFCPECSNIMKKRMDSKMYKIHKKCFDCVIEFETRLRQEGKFEEYQRNILNANKDALLDETLEALDAWASVKDTFVNEAGDIENWGGGEVNKEEVVRLKEYVQELKNKSI